MTDAFPLADEARDSPIADVGASMSEQTRGQAASQTQSPASQEFETILIQPAADSEPSLVDTHPLAEEFSAAAVAEDDDVQSAVAELTSAIQMLRIQLSTDQDIISRMQARIEALQADQVRALLGPVVTELAALHASIDAAAARDYDQADTNQVRTEFAFLSSRVENALDLLGVTSVDAKPGDAFDSRRHTALRQILTSDAAQDATIAEVQRQGFVFEYESKPAIYARVTVYAYDTAAPAPPESVLDTIPEQEEEEPDNG